MKASNHSTPAAALRPRSSGHFTRQVGHRLPPKSRGRNTLPPPDWRKGLDHEDLKAFEHLTDLMAPVVESHLQLEALVQQTQQESERQNQVRKSAAEAKATKLSPGSDSGGKGEGKDQNEGEIEEIIDGDASGNAEPAQIDLAPDPNLHPFVDESAVQALKKELFRATRENDQLRKREVAKVLELGCRRRLATIPEMAAVEDVERRFGNFHGVLDHVRNCMARSLRNDPPHFEMSPLLLNGPPGIGKTTFVQALAELFRTRAFLVDMPALDIASRLTGGDAQYEGATPGVIWEALSQACMAPIVILDEIEKYRRTRYGSPIDILLRLMEPTSSRRFMDGFVRLEVDASHIIWMATSNGLESLSAPFLDRMRVFEIEAPSQDLAPKVVLSVWENLRAKYGWASCLPKELPTDVLQALQGLTPRHVRMAIEDAAGNAARAGRMYLLASDLPARQPEVKRPTMGFLGS